ncbi:PREDICTED: uncharacterized protein LOC103082143 [Lipotes vexillifer]|uniref:Uncharacterized protein LOC103082143 n=1 Tax=Lipotes vexillifer TaxID=118797 RepID=A0A340XE33_LIPVE|nr:PREDICTED: uncharacterized protein LOC103082143 [Lipotes vexillifer]
MELGGAVQEKGGKGEGLKLLPTLPPCTRRWQLPSNAASALFDLALTYGKSTATSGKMAVAAPSPILSPQSRPSSNTISSCLPAASQAVPIALSSWKAGLEEKPKEGVKIENNDHTNFKMAGMDGSLVHFMIKRHTALSKLMKPITPAQLEMKDEDAVDVFQQQIGGVYSKGNLLLYCRTLFLWNIKTCSQLENPIWSYHILTTAV